ncbi:MAG: hypothetical protein LBS16_06545 [Prevotellaceae bacterium]|jgi:uncharacterized protein (TIGR02145 family)|nr:hypothetical protein [Prevotellaceae bacterium]
MKTNQFLFAALTAAFLSVASFSAAQVTIGGSDLPKAGTIVDLNPQNGVKGGLALSNVYLTRQTHIPVGANLFPGITHGTNDDVNPALAGTIIYNTNADFGLGVFVWDGDIWQPVGAHIYTTTIPAPTCSSIAPTITFMAYNLGADVAKLMSLYPTLSPAKQQIKYLALVPTISATDATVWGDLYQWGRIRDGHEKRNSTIYSGPLTQASDVDANGQPKAGKGQGQLITVPDGTNNNDWSNPQDNTLWGNGVSVGVETPDGVLASDGKYYQSTNWVIPDNNPCPIGWHIPTQDEWERLTDYGCGAPQTAGGDFYINTSTEYYKSLSGTNAPLTWVRVKDGKAYQGTWSDGDRSGFAVYETAVWTAAIAENGYFHDGGNPDYTRPLYEANAPEPLLFLPAVGARNRPSGSLVFTGSRGHYWSSTVTDISDRFKYFASEFVGNSNIAGGRASCLGVRCVK